MLGLALPSQDERWGAASGAPTAPAGSGICEIRETPMTDHEASSHSQVRRFRADRSLQGMRLSKAVAVRVGGLSVRAGKSLVDLGRVFVNGQRVRMASFRLRGTEEIEVHLDRLEETGALTPEHILREGRSLLVINKPTGLVVFGTRGETEGTVLPELERFLRAAGKWGQEDSLILVHRLDKDTSGLLLLARRKESARDLERQFRQGKVEKRYLTLVEGNPKHDKFRQASSVRARRPLGEVSEERSSGPPSQSPPTARRSETEFVVLERFSGCALLEARPLTGRTHQIRIHLAQLGHPVLGDIVYGRAEKKDPLLRSIPRQMLHAAFLRIRDPDTGTALELQAPLPEDMRHLLETLRKR